MWLYVLIVSVVYVIGALVRVRSHPDKSTNHTHTTDDKHIQPHTAQTINERISAELNLATAQSTAYAPPEDGRISGPIHVAVTSLNGF